MATAEDYTVVATRAGAVLVLGDAHGYPALHDDGAQVRGVVEVAAGAEHACARGGDGSVWCWGANSEGQLGDGTRLARLAPIQVITGAW